jgi:hypothetical protein
MAINNSTGARVSWLLFFCLTGILSFVHAQELNKSKASPSPTVTEDAGTWFLAGREGGCAPTSILSRKGPEYGNVQSPYQLVEKLRAAGHKADLKELSTGKSPAVEITAPSAGLAVLFVKKEFCEKMLAPPAKN